MARTTFRDRARKARIREREYRQMAMQLRKLDDITDAQIKALQKVKAAEVGGTPVKTTAVPHWKELREMGALRESEGTLILTSIGAQVVAHTSK